MRIETGFLMSEKRYLGDSVYANFDGYHVVLTTENGYGPSNTIALEPAVLDALNEYVKGIYGQRTTTED
jgi:hypothetical protein